MIGKRTDIIENNFLNKKIAVIGDLMLDGYFWGEVTRVSPEAPVPVVEIEDEFFRFGGAANVALNIVHLGSMPFPIGVIGNDSNGKIFMDLINEEKINPSGIFADKERPTTTKTRVIANTQHIVRIDKENKNYLNGNLEIKILNFLETNISKLDAVILQDYNKGVLTENIIRETISIANNNNKIIAVDPKFINFRNYQNVTVFKPNKKETEDFLGIKITNDQDISFAGQELLNQLNAKYVLLTLGEKGIALFEKNKKEIRIPTKARKVRDVSGAGDTVIAALTCALSAGATIEEAAYIANYAGGLVCEEVGIVPIEKEKLFNIIKEK